MKGIKWFLLATLICVSGSMPASARQKSVQKEQLMSYMVRNEIAKVCVEIDIAEDGELSISKSSGDAEIDRVSLNSLAPRGMLSRMRDSAVDIGDGKKRVKLRLDIADNMKNGKVYCSAI